MANAVHIRRNVHRPDRAKQVMAAQPAQNRRLTGALANATAIAQSAEAFERIDVREYTKIGVGLLSLATGAGTSLLDIFPMDSTATGDDTDSATRIAAGAAVQDTFNAATAASAYTSLDVSEFEYVEVVVTSGAVGGNNTNIDWVDIFLS